MSSLTDDVRRTCSGSPTGTASSCSSSTTDPPTRPPPSSRPSRRSRPEVRVLRQPVNMRLGQALRDGFAASLGDIVVVFDSDLSYSVDHIGRMLETMDARPCRDRGCVAVHEGRQDLRDPVATGADEQADQPGARRHQPIRRARRSPAWFAPTTATFIRGLSLKSMGPEINTEILYKAQIMRARVGEIPAHLDWSDQAERMAKPQGVAARSPPRRSCSCSPASCTGRSSSS